MLETAAATPGVGAIEETLQWGEPAYLTAQSGSGSTIQIDWKKARPDRYAMYFNCNTTLVDGFRSLFPLDGSPPKDAVVFCVAAALTYHRPPMKAATAHNH